ncbi:MAG TPA: sugar transferase [Streptosporangiaceae bacterium]|nr:sugar transferase [Streptosporangiaceae bacterium]
MSVTGQAVGTHAERGHLIVRPEESTACSWIPSYLRRAAAVDSTCALGAGALTASIRFGGLNQIPVIYIFLIMATPLLWWISLLIAGGYDARIIGLGSDEFRRVINAGASLAIAAMIISYLTQFQLSRWYLTATFLGATGADLVCRSRLRKRLHAQRRRGRRLHRVVAAGQPGAVADLISTFRRDSYHGLSVVAACVTSDYHSDQLAGVPVAGSFDRLPAAVSDFGADTVAVLAGGEIDSDRLRELAWSLEKTGTDLCVAPILLDVAGPRTTIRPVAGLPLLYVDHPELKGGKRIVKDIFDRAAAGAALVLLAPLFGAIALAIKCIDPGPVFFRQTRIGRDGQDFTVYKFRTMRADAERLKARYFKRNEASGVLFKIRHDPRVTKTGRWLRRWSLDELPQLANVLAGDMSLVGPRPHLPEEAAQYCDAMRRRLAVKPGITGLWQVSGRSDLSWDETVRLDVRYVENWSLALDLQILWKTCSAVISGTGAY